MHLVKTEAKESSYVALCEFQSDSTQMIVQLWIIKEEFMFFNLAKISSTKLILQKLVLANLKYINFAVNRTFC